MTQSTHLLHVIAHGEPPEAAALRAQIAAIKAALVGATDAERMAARLEVYRLSGEWQRTVKNGARRA